MDAIALGELEHGIERGLGGAFHVVVFKVREDVRVGTSAVVHQINRVVRVAEAETSFHPHSKLACKR